MIFLIEFFMKTISFLHSVIFLNILGNTNTTRQCSLIKGIFLKDIFIMSPLFMRFLNSHIFSTVCLQFWVTIISNMKGTGLIKFIISILIIFGNIKIIFSCKYFWMYKHFYWKYIIYIQLIYTDFNKWI